MGLVVFMFSFLAACGGGSGGSEDAPIVPPTTDVIAPTVHDLSPANSANSVGINTAINVTFSEVVQALTAVNFVVTANNVTIGGALVTNGATATFTPAASLQNNTTYNVVISGVKDTIGNVMATPYNASFTTLAASVTDTTAPYVVATSPTNNATNVAVSTAIVVTLNESVQANIGTVTLTQNNVAVPSAITYNGATITIAPTNALTANLVYVIAASGLKDITGNVMTNNLSSQFTTAAGAVVVTPPTQAEVNAAGIQLKPWNDSSKAAGYVEGKAYWNGTAWEKQVVVFNGNANPALSNPVWRYVINLVPPTTAPAAGQSRNFGIQGFLP